MSYSGYSCASEDAATATYLFTDIYCQEYWTPVLP